MIIILCFYSPLAFYKSTIFSIFFFTLFFVWWWFVNCSKKQFSQTIIRCAHLLPSSPSSTYFNSWIILTLLCHGMLLLFSLLLLIWLLLLYFGRYSLIAMGRVVSFVLDIFYIRNGVCKTGLGLWGCHIFWKIITREKTDCVMKQTTHWVIKNDRWAIRTFSHQRILEYSTVDATNGANLKLFLFYD